MVARGYSITLDLKIHIYNAGKLAGPLDASCVWWEARQKIGLDAGKLGSVRHV